jgi:cytosine/adenosine deaminase-related metal-dependent hydrolase
VEDEDAAFADCIRLIDTYHDSSRFSMCRLSLAPCAPFVVTNDMMKRCAVLARK